MFRYTHSIVVSTVLVALLVGNVGCGGPVERKAKYRERAEQHMAERNYPKARVALRNLLKIDPNDVDAHFLFAQIEEKEKNWRNAVANYERVIELSPTHKGARLKLAKYYLEVGAVDRVEETAASILRADPQDPDAAALRLAILAVQGHAEDALVQARTLVSAHPTAVDPAVLLATLLSRQGAHSEAERVLRTLIASRPNDVELLSILANTLISAGSQSSAQAVYAQIIALEPWVYDHRLNLALLHDRQGHVDEAEAVLREAVRMEPKSERRHLTLADFLATRRSPEQGERALDEAEATLPSPISVRMARGALYQRTHQTAKARAVYQALADDQRGKPAGLDAQVRLATLHILDGQIEQAEALIQDVLRDNPRAIDALLVQGKLAMQKQDGRRAITAFRTIVKDQPENADGYLMLGEAYVLTQEPNLAREMFEKAIALNASLVRAQRALALLDLQDRRPVDAARRLDAILARDPNDAESLDLRLSIAVSTEDWPSADALVARLRQTRPNHYLTDMTEGAISEARHRYDDAGAFYERARVRNPNAPDPLVALAKTESAQGKGDRTRARLEALLKDEPTHLYAHGLLGELLVAGQRTEDGERHLREAVRLKPDWSQPWAALAAVEAASHREAQALRTLEDGIARTHGSLDLRMMVAALHTQADRIDEAIRAYEQILHTHPQALLAANNLAALLVERKGDAQSLERALAVSKEFERAGDNPVLLDTLGFVHLKMGHGQEAVRLFTQAIGHAPNHPLLNYHLGLAYYELGDRPLAKKYLSAAMSTKDAFDGRAKAEALLAQLGV